jgi:hypothetical protein
MGNMVFHGQLTRSQARLAHNTMYIPALLYSLPAMNLTEQETNKIQQCANTKFIQSIGVSWSFPRAVVYGPKEFGGMGLPYLYSESGCIKVECILNNFKTESELSIAMRIVLIWLQLHAGSSIPILESKQLLEYIPNNWFMSVKTFIYKIDATISIKNLWTPQIFRSKDVIIMDIVDQMEVSTTIKRIFNNWRIFFRINVLSELTNAQGTHISGKFLSKYCVADYIPTSTLQWPNQKSPHLKYFTVWINILRQIFGIDNRGKLPTRMRLGRWLTKTTYNVPSNVNFLINNNNQTVAVRNTCNNLWYSHNISHQLRSTFFYHKDPANEISQLNETEYDRADAIIDGLYIKINKRNIKELPQKTSVNTKYKQQSLQETIRNKQTWYNALTNHAIVLSENEIFMDPHDQIKISTDGGAKDGRGSFGVVVSKHESILIENKSRLPPIHNAIHLYRCEGMGILCGLVILEEIIKNSKNLQLEQPRNIMMESDSKLMVDKINKIRH